MSTPGAELAPRTRDRTVDFCIFALALALRIAVVFGYQSAHPHAEHLVIDEQSYDSWARRIAGGEWVGREVFFQEPLYPYVLGVLYKVFGPERLVVRIFQCILGALTCVLAGWIARRIFGRVAGFVAALAMAVYWPSLLFSCLFLKENLFLPLLAALVLCLLRTLRDGGRARDWIAIGVLTGLGALLRGNMLLLAPFFVLWPFLRAIRMRGNAVHAMARVASALGGLTLVLLPVAVRNQAVGGVFALTTSGAGTNLYGGNNRENPYGRATEFSFVRGVPEHEAGDWKREAERRTGTKLDPGEVSSYWRGEVLRSIAADPWLHASILWNKLRLSLGWYEVPDNHLLYWDAQYVPLAALPFPRFGVVGVLGLAGLLFMLAQRLSRGEVIQALAYDAAAARELALVFALYLATIVLTVTSDRARLPLVPLLAPFAGFLVAAHVHAVRTRQRIALAFTAACLVAGMVIVYLPVLSAAERADDWDEREFNLAVQRRDEPGKLGDAREIALGLVERHPQSARALLLLAELDYRRARALTGDASAAEARSRALAETLALVQGLLGRETLKPRERYAAQRLAAWIELELERWADAEQHFRQARAFAPGLREDQGLALALLSNAAVERREERYDEAHGIVDACFAVEDRVLRARLELALAAVEYALATAWLSGGERKAEAQDTIERGLQRLEGLVKDDAVPSPLKQRARMQAGWIQHYLKNDKAAENQFRAALAIGPHDEADLGLAYALYNRNLGETDDARRRARADELDALLRRLSSSQPVDPRVQELVDRVAHPR